MKRLLALILALLYLSGPPQGARAAGVNSCVSCHRDVKQSDALQHTFSDWEQSPHGKSGVACQSCHGGDHSFSSKHEAHADLLSSSNSKSRVYFTKIPETCGACHAAEFQAFKKSAHYRELKRTGRGPNCVTCHGSMANRVIGPREMEMTCNLCHHKPRQAYAARLAVEEAREALRDLDQAAEQARSSGKTAVDKRDYIPLHDRFHAVLVAWHTFDAKKVLAQAKDIAREASAMSTDLKLKRKSP